MRKMNRTELIEIIYALQQDEQALRQTNEELTAQLQDRILRIESAGSIAEAALSLNHVFEDAQEAAEQYLQSVQEAAQMQSEAAQMMGEAEAQRAEVQQLLSEAHRQKQQAENYRKWVIQCTVDLVRRYPEAADLLGLHTNKEEKEKDHAADNA